MKLCSLLIWEYINCSQTYECGNWDEGRENGIFVAVHLFFIDWTPKYFFDEKIKFPFILSTKPN
jgi:hypothetical protein